MKNLTQLTQLLQQKKLTIAVAESCTGGNLSALLTSVGGSSSYFDRGFITYSNQAKMDMLGVQSSTLDKFGAVSEQTAAEMVRGVIAHATVDVGVSITGIAGPAGGTSDKPVGTVCFGFCIMNECFTSQENFSGDRTQIVQSSISFVVDTLIHELSS